MYKPTTDLTPREEAEYTRLNVHDKSGPYHDLAYQLGYPPRWILNLAKLREYSDDCEISGQRFTKQTGEIMYSTLLAILAGKSPRNLKHARSWLDCEQSATSDPIRHGYCGLFTVSEWKSLGVMTDHVWYRLKSREAGYQRNCQRLDTLAFIKECQAKLFAGGDSALDAADLAIQSALDLLTPAPVEADAVPFEVPDDSGKLAADSGKLAAKTSQSPRPATKKPAPTPDPWKLVIARLKGDKRRYSWAVDMQRAGYALAKSPNGQIYADTANRIFYAAQLAA